MHTCVHVACLCVCSLIKTSCWITSLPFFFVNANDKANANAVILLPSSVILSGMNSTYIYIFFNSSPIPFFPFLAFVSVMVVNIEAVHVHTLSMMCFTDATHHVLVFPHAASIYSEICTSVAAVPMPIHVMCSPE